MKNHVNGHYRTDSVICCPDGNWYRIYFWTKPSGKKIYYLAAEWSCPETAWYERFGDYHYDWKKLITCTSDGSFFAKMIQQDKI